MIRVKAIPQALQSLRRWVMWKYVIRGSKAEKLPFRAFNGMASVSDENTWVSYDEAIGQIEKFDGVGFVFDERDGLCGIDFDACRNPDTGAIEQWAKDWIAKLDSYSEVSPSETGVKVVIRGKSPFPNGRKVVVAAETTSADKQPGIEVYDRRRYFCITGWRIGGGLSPDVEERQAVLDELCKHFFPPPKAPPTTAPLLDNQITERARKYVSTMPGSISGQGGHNAAFRVACVLILGFSLSHDQAFALMSEWNNKCEPVWSEREINHKLKSAEQQQGERGFLIGVREDQYETYKLPKFAVGKPTEVEPKPIEHTTLASTAELYIDAIKRGDIRHFSLGVPHLDDAMGGGVAEGEMVVVAARPSHGKTAIALQAIHYATANGFPCLFISEEMGKMTIGKRVIQFASSVNEQKWNESVGTLELDVKHHFRNRKECYFVEGVKTAERACALIRKYVEEYGVKYVALDYVGKLSAAGGNRVEQIGAVSSMIQRVAAETGIIMIVLAQMNRAVEHRPVFIPTMSDLKETGQIEQDADVILFNVWPWKLDSTKDPNEFLVFLSKNRNREIRRPVIKMRFNGARQMFVEEGLVGDVTLQAGLTGSMWNPDAAIKESEEF